MASIIPQNFSWRSSSSQPVSQQGFPNISMKPGDDLMTGIVECIKSLCDGNVQEDINTQLDGLQKNISLYRTRYGVICNDNSFKALLERELNNEYRNWMVSCNQYGANPTQNYIHNNYVTKFNPIYIKQLMDCSVNVGSVLINE